MDRFEFERALWRKNVARVAGVDEAGRVIFPDQCVSNFSLSGVLPLGRTSRRASLRALARARLRSNVERLTIWHENKKD